MDKSGLVREMSDLSGQNCAKTLVELLARNKRMNEIDTGGHGLEMNGDIILFPVTPVSNIDELSPFTILGRRSIYCV